MYSIANQTSALTLEKQYGNQTNKARRKKARIYNSNYKEDKV